MALSFIRNPSDMGFDGEDQDENIILLLRRHLITNLDWVLISVFLFLIPNLTLLFFNFLGIRTPAFLSIRLISVLNIFWYLFTLGYIFENFLNWFFNIYIVTNKRIIDMDFYGLLHRSISEAPLSNIEDVTHNISGAAQIIFNYGDVIIQTAGEKREFDFTSVPNPNRVQDIISDLVSGIIKNDNNQ